jgi:hypothetical protein
MRKIEHTCVVAKAALLRENGIPSLTMESDLYKLRIYYNGDYEKDHVQNSLNPAKIMASCETKADVPELTVFDGKVLIKNTLPAEISVADMENILQSFTKISNDMKMLQHVYDDYFSTT